MKRYKQGILHCHVLIHEGISIQNLQDPNPEVEHPWGCVSTGCNWVRSVQGCQLSSQDMEALRKKQLGQYWDKYNKRTRERFSRSAKDEESDLR